MPGMLSQASISATFLLLLASLPSSTPTCFLPNGTAHQDEGTSRCSSISGSPLYNTCCQTQWPNPPGGDVINGPTADECMPNGLCQNRGFSSAPGQEAEPWTHFYRVYCANANWEAPVATGTGTGEEPTPSSDAANLSGQNGEKQDEGKSNSGRNIGIGVGVGAGVGALLGIAVTILLRRRKSKQKTREIENEIAEERQKQDLAKGYHHVAEMPHQEPVCRNVNAARDVELTLR
ncbi:uncharacterized protein J4E78_006272 [Alternaria triticimaculans]|uniref:uncharacterized protein n=1 Tax=Alternaria triticimaculans TaxID=297637 RepID=UPI0020C586EF|nr:uncharacterized protein J4E78_006272 [Alternaria triticimaculans]KAI4657883.1 hypothetical protein J4E78_006272 [Alternaria triticimaculans]